MAERIEDYALLGDTQSAALVGRTGSVDWLCLPRFDSQACFAALLGTERNGLWRLAPADGGVCSRRRYRGDSLILESEWDTAEGTVRVIDFMPPRGEAPDVVRIVECLAGRVDMSSELRIRFDYGRTIPWMRRLDGTLAGIAGPDSIFLRTPVPSTGRDLTTYADFTVRTGDRVPFVLTWQASHLPPPAPVDPEAALQDTEQWWADWLADCHYDGEWREEVHRSLVTLKGLTYRPTGGIVAAATTSLPEAIGGPRNWDYRYCWLRDSTMTLQAMIYAGFLDEARAWREWLLRAIAGDPADLQIMYGVAGERRLPEYEADWLAGYEGSRPVRLGNAAVDQFQLDVYGEVLDSLYLARESGLEPDDESWRLQCAVVRYLETSWDHKDDGLWEIRGDRQDFVHSKVMAWAGVDRAVRTLENGGFEGPLDRWKDLRRRIHREVCEKGFNSDKGCFTQYYGSNSMDAALLLIPQVGFLPASDQRVVATIDAVQRELDHGGFIRRYDPAAGVDGLPGNEGAFLACTFWLADDLFLLGRKKEARELFERLLGLRNDVGLLAEEYDPESGRMLGNLPQAFSHVPLVNTARNLSAKGRHIGPRHRQAPPAHARTG